MTVTAGPPATQPAPETRRALVGSIGAADASFRALARTSGFTVLAIMGLVGVFLAVRGVSALREAGLAFFTTAAWEPDGGQFGIAAVLTGTVLIGLVAILTAVPLAVGTALYISEYAPRGLQRGLISLVDLMAAVPSVVYGLWGVYFLQQHVAAVAKFLATYFAWVPLFRIDSADPRDPLTSLTTYTSSTVIAGIVVGLMITPIASSVMREAFSQAPAGEREGAYALGATKWGMVRAVVLPFGRGGIIGGTMLGLGRALGETIAVVMIISLVLEIQPRILETNGSSISALIALRYGEATEFGTSALMAAGLTLFAVTLVINFFASALMARSRSGAASEV